jgi:hypothetical protein
MKTPSHIYKVLALCASLTVPVQAIEPQEYGSEKYAWKIGGKIHFEEKDGINYLGLITLNRKTIDALSLVFQVDKENVRCANNAKVLFEKESNGKFAIRHYEEKRNPGVGEEMHATLLYTTKRIQNGHETLKDIYKNLQEVDASLPHNHAPTVEQIAKTYQMIISPDLEFSISDIVFIRGGGGNVIIAKLTRDEIVNEKGHSVSGGFLHISLANIHPSVLLNSEDEEKVTQAVLMLNEILSGKRVKIACKNGQVDLEFGISGSSLENRIRPTVVTGQTTPPN